MCDKTAITDILTRAIDSMSTVQTGIQLARRSLASYLLDNNVSPNHDSPTSVYSNVSAATTAETNYESSNHCQGLQSAIAKFQNGGIDSSRIFVVRKVHGLVNDAADVLKSYFSRYGRVCHVELLPSRRRCGRLRPSTTGFVILENAESVSIILNETMVHHVTDEHCVEVTPFMYPQGATSSCAVSALL